jgi:L-alanine-DL-glutamate epimerase-like enolase superfamily enzyme
MIDHAGIGFVQIDAGRIGGISAAREVATYAREREVTYVNHTFTSHLALSASLQPFLDHEHDVICEYPVAPKSLAWDITVEPSGTRRRGVGACIRRAGPGDDDRS